jgi:fructose-1,6-bisphosphatase
MANTTFTSLQAEVCGTVSEEEMISSASTVWMKNHQNKYIVLIDPI